MEASLSLSLSLKTLHKLPNITPKKKPTTITQNTTRISPETERGHERGKTHHFLGM